MRLSFQCSLWRKPAGGLNHLERRCPLGGTTDLLTAIRSSLTADGYMQLRGCSSISAGTRTGSAWASMSRAGSKRARKLSIPRAVKGRLAHVPHGKHGPHRFLDPQAQQRGRHGVRYGDEFLPRRARWHGTYPRGRKKRFEVNPSGRMGGIQGALVPVPAFHY